MGKWDFLQPCDEEVLGALASGDVQQAFYALIEGYQGPVVSYCIALVGHADEGEDVAQEVFIAIEGALHRFESRSTVRSWVFAIARHKCQKHLYTLRNRWRIFRAKRHLIQAEAVPDPQAQPADLYDAVLHHEHIADALKQVRESLRDLDSWSRTLMMMYYYEELSFRAIAKQLWVSESKVRRDVHAAEAQLRVHLGLEERCT